MAILGNACCSIFISLVRFAFATQPTNTTAIQNSNTFINCEVDGTEIINITWVSSNGLTINRDSSHISIVTTSSSTRVSSTLQFPNVQMSQSEGWYTCICYSHNGSTDNIISIAAGAYLYVQSKMFTYIIIQRYHTFCKDSIPYISNSDVCLNVCMYAYIYVYVVPI